MTIDEKLQHFYDSSVEDARQEASQAISAHQKRLEEMLAQHKKTQQLSAEAEIKAETENAKREVNKALSAQQLTIKRDWSVKQNDLEDKLFMEVKDRLDAFMETSQYDDYLAERINEAKEFAGKDELYIYLSPADSARIHSLSARTDFPLQIAEESFMGGIKAMIPSKNILIDHSFLEVFQSLRKDFNFDFGGGPKHE